MFQLVVVVVVVRGGADGVFLLIGLCCQPAPQPPSSLPAKRRRMRDLLEASQSPRSNLPRPNLRRTLSNRQQQLIKTQINWLRRDQNLEAQETALRLPTRLVDLISRMSSSARACWVGGLKHRLGSSSPRPSLLTRLMESFFPADALEHQ